MSENKILTQCFDREELSDKKRPDTVRCVSVCSEVFHTPNRTLLHPSILSHNQTNSGVFPFPALSGLLDGDSLRLPAHLGMP